MDPVGRPPDYGMALRRKSLTECRFVPTFIDAIQPVFDYSLDHAILPFFSRVLLFGAFAVLGLLPTLEVFPEMKQVHLDA
jgi:hypothetical protein